MLTMHDIIITNNDWNEIPLLDNGTAVEVICVNEKALAKFGTNSDTDGLLLEPRDVIRAPQSIFIKRYNKNRPLKIIAVRDGKTS